MPDISMCQNNDCLFNQECYRFTAKPDAVQSYSTFSDKSNVKGFNACDFYMGKGTGVRLSGKHVCRLGSALGVAVFNSVLSDKKKDKVLPKEYYRNRIYCKPNDMFDFFVKQGILDKECENESVLCFYWLTNKGIQVFEKNYKKIVQYKKPNERDLIYLKNKINFCSEVYDYDFKAEDVIQAYCQPYNIELVEINKTINDFKTELKKYLGKNL